ncbi:MAG: cupin domain-containing protein [Pedobacter sp.]|nr:cupin domain-containing protein [Chitinophagaceae bacterium]
MKKRDIVIALSTALVMCVPLAIIANQQQQKLIMPSTAFNWDSIKVVATKVGEKRQFFDAPTITLDNLECHVTSLNPGESAHAPHQHPEEELTIVKEGTVEVLVNGEFKRVGPGSVVFQAANTLHSIKNVGSGMAVYHAIKWKSNKTEKVTK